MTSSDKALRHESGTGIRDSIVECINDHANRIDMLYKVWGKEKIEQALISYDAYSDYSRKAEEHTINDFLSGVGEGPWCVRDCVAKKMHHSVVGDYSIDRIHLDSRQEAIAVCAALNWLERNK